MVFPPTPLGTVTPLHKTLYFSMRETSLQSSQAAGQSGIADSAVHSLSARMCRGIVSKLELAWELNCVVSSTLCLSSLSISLLRHSLAYAAACFFANVAASHVGTGGSPAYVHAASFVRLSRCTPASDSFTILSTSRRGCTRTHLRQSARKRMAAFAGQSSGT